MAKVSVVVPVYKVEPYLEQCLNSIVNQSFFDIEIIIIDNGGEDRCPEICRNFAQIDKRIKLIRLEKNIGLKGAVQKGLSVVSTDFVMFCDSDDYVAKDYVEVLYQAIIKSEVDCVSSGHTEIFKDKTLTFYKSPGKVYTKEIIELELLQPFFEATGNLWDIFGNHRWGKIYKTPLLKKAAALSDPNISMAEDLETNLIFLSLCSSVEVLGDYIGYFYRMDRDDSISNVFSLNRLEQNEIFTKKLYKLAKDGGRKGAAIAKRHKLFNFHEMSICLKNNVDFSLKKQFVKRALETVDQDLLIDSSIEQQLIFLSANVQDEQKTELIQLTVENINNTKILTTEQKDSLYINMMLCLASSDVSNDIKLSEIKKLKLKLSDNKAILNFLKNKSIKEKISCYLVYYNLESLLLKLIDVMK